MMRYYVALLQFCCFFKQHNKKPGKPGFLKNNLILVA